MLESIRQEEKAFAPIEMTELGSLTERREVHFEKAESSIAVTPSGMMIS
jgi:hypothetical protein